MSEIRWTVQRHDGTTAASVAVTDDLRIVTSVPSELEPDTARGLGRALADASGYAQRARDARAPLEDAFEELGPEPITTERPMERLEQLLEEAQAALSRMTPDEQLHHRHEQRVSFAAGNVALSWHEGAETEAGESPLARATRLARDAAGPCPCASCSGLAYALTEVARTGEGFPPAFLDDDDEPEAV